MTEKMDDTQGLKLLGGGSMTAPAGEPDAGMLEAFHNLFPERDYLIRLEFPEYTSLCPVTGQPDFGLIVIEYIPDQWCVESKSFKLYMFAYRNSRAFMETLTNKILEDLAIAIDPRWIRVKGMFAPRGGTRINVFAERYKAMEKPRLTQVRRAVRDWLLQAESKR